MATHSSILAWRIPWQRSKAGYSPWGLKESDTAEWLTLTLHITSLFTRQLHFLFLFFLCLRKNPWLSACAQVTPHLVFLVLSISINCPTPTLVAQEQSLGAILNFSFSHFLFSLHQKVLWPQPPKQLQNSAYLPPSHFLPFWSKSPSFPRVLIWNRMLFLRLVMTHPLTDSLPLFLISKSFLPWATRIVLNISQIICLIP